MTKGKRPASLPAGASMIKETVERVRNNLFFIPSLFLAASVILAWVAVALDRSGFGDGSVFLLPTSVSGARAVLATVAGATITVAAVVFSLTAVTVQLASNQYSPRLLSEFLNDRFQQVTVGVVAGTFTFSLIALGTIGGGTTEFTGVAAAWATTISTALGVTTVVTIVAFIAHVMTSLHVDNVIRRLSHDTTTQFAVVFADQHEGRETGEPWQLAPHTSSITVPAPETGWVQEVITADLMNALAPGHIARVDTRAGHYVVVGEPLLTVWAPEPFESPASTDQYIRRLSRSVQIGAFRTISHDPGFGLRQLIDIALKALSPGINDPTTAGDVLHHMVEPLRIVVSRRPGRRVLKGPEGRSIGLPNELDQADYIRMAFSEIRLAAERQPHVALALGRTLLSLRTLAAGESVGGALDEQFDLLCAAIDGWGIPASDVREITAAADEYRELTGAGSES